MLEIFSRWTATMQLVLLALAALRASALSQEYCASFNTGSAGKSSSDDFMTNGKCHDSCSGYAFAVVQFKDCWCSNYAPGGASDGRSCAVDCPGYPFEKCGDKQQGLYGYVALGPEPAGTQGGSSSSSPSQTAQSSYQPSNSPDRSPVTVQDTVTATPSVQVSVVSITPSQVVQTSIATTSRIVPVSTSESPSSPSSTPSSTPATTSSKTSKPSSSWTPTPYMTVETVTGQVKTMTITPSEPPQATQTIVTAAEANQANRNGFFSSPGKVAGVFVAIAIILAALIAGLVFFCWRRRRRQDQEALPSTAGSHTGTPQRRPSRMSQMGLLGSQKGRSGDLPKLQTSWGPGNSAEKSPADTLDRRSSYPRIVDQRLEPAAVWNPLHDNGSHVSIRSFRDDQDYSRRMLRVANPDQ